MAVLRMGYVGAGFVGQRIHIPNIASLDDCDLVALAELRPRLGEAVRKRWGIDRLYRSHRDLAADGDVQAVGVSAHYVQQAEIAADLLAAGKHVFMEKPMALSVGQAERILDAARGGGSRLMVGYMKRYDGGNVAARRIIDELRSSGELGAVTYARNHGFCGTDWTAGGEGEAIETDEPKAEPPALAGFVPAWLPERMCGAYVGFLQQYTHNVNLLRYLLDAGDDARVKFVDLGERNRGVTVFEMRGVRAVIESGHVAYHGWEENTQVYFEKGWVKVTSPPLLLKNLPATVEVFRAASPGCTRCEVFPETGWTWSFREEMRHFVQAVLREEPFRSPGEDTLTDVRLFEEIFRMLLEQGARE
jgi:predicted dehydrogenase